jgi:hypothetical protein
MMFTTCPGCGELAEVVEHFVLSSTDGPVEHVRTHCLQRHWFLTPLRDDQGVD